MREEIEEVVFRILAGDRGERSFEIVYNLWCRRFLSFFARQGVPAEARGDLAQETLVRLYKRLRRGGEIHHFDGFCWIIARNVFKRWLERKAREEARYGDRICYMPDSVEEIEGNTSLEPWPIPVSHPASPDASYREKELWEKLERLIDTLPGQKTRQCAWLSFIEGLSNVEIASVMGIATGNVGYKLHVVRKRPEFVAFLAELRKLPGHSDLEVGS